MQHYDTVIIGSGVSGMTAGIILAKSGRRVLVLEQNKKPGGLMQTFWRGSNLFPTGVHKLGSLGSGETLAHYFKYIGVFERLSLVPMDPSRHETFVFPEFSFTAPGGYKAFFSSLVKAFPQEKEAIMTYLCAMEKTVGQFPLYNLTKPAPELPSAMDFSISIYSLLSGLGCSDKLIKVLTANKLLHGMEPEECPALVHFFVTDSFLNSSWRIDETRTSLAGAFVGAFSEAGGSLRCSARVSSLNCTAGGIKGVSLFSGEEIVCNEVVFTGHPRSMIDICPEKAFRPAFRNRIQRAENTSGTFGFAAKWMYDACPLALGDVYLYLSEASDLKYPGDFFPGGTLESIYLSGMPCPQEGAFSMTALTPVSEIDSQRLMELKEADNQGYINVKKAMAESMLGAIYDMWSSARDKIEIVATYTPLTFSRYTLSPLGTAYGIKKSAKTFWKNQFNPATRVRGLFLAGQSLTTSGVMGALLSSVQACTAMENMSSLPDTISQDVSQ